MKRSSTFLLLLIAVIASHAQGSTEPGGRDSTLSNSRRYGPSDSNARTHGASVLKDLTGKRLLTTTMSYATFGYTTQNQSQGYVAGSAYNFGLLPSVLFGKVNSQGLLIAYGGGISFGYGSNHYDSVRGHSTAWGVHPQLLVERFIQLKERIFYTPAAVMSGDYTTGKDQPGNTHSHTLGASMEVSPLALTFQFKPKLYLLVMLGQVGVEYTHYHNHIPLTVASERPDVNTWTIGGFAHQYTIGLQWLL